MRIKPEPDRAELLLRSAEAVVPNKFTGQVRVDILNGVANAIFREEDDD